MWFKGLEEGWRVRVGDDAYRELRRAQGVRLAVPIIIIFVVIIVFIGNAFPADVISVKVIQFAFLLGGLIYVVTFPLIRRIFLSRAAKFASIHVKFEKYFPGRVIQTSVMSRVVFFDQYLRSNGVPIPSEIFPELAADQKVSDA